MTTERNSTRIDLLEDRAIQDQHAEWDVDTSRVETQNTSRGMEGQTTGFDLVGNNSTLREMVDGVMRTSIPLLHPQPLLLYILDQLLELSHAN